MLMCLLIFILYNKIKKINTTQLKIKPLLITKPSFKEDK